MSSSELDAFLRDGREAKPANLPWNVAQRIEDTLYSLPARETLKRGTQRRIRMLAITIASIAVIGGAIASSVMLSADQPSEVVRMSTESTIQHQPEFIRTPMMASLTDDSYMKQSGPSVTDQGITLMVRDITYDGYEMAIRYSVASVEDIDDYTIDASIAMDKHEIGKVGYLTSDEQLNLSHRYEKLETGQYEGNIRTWNLTYADYRPASFRLKLKVTRIGSQKGSWSFDIPVTITKNLSILYPEESKTAVDGTLTINRILLSPVTTIVEHHFEEGKLDSSWFGIEVRDDKGTYLGSHSSNNIRSINFLQLGPLDNGVKALILRPFYEDYRNNKRMELTEYYNTPLLKLPTKDEPLVLPLGEVGETHITGIEYLADKTVVHSKSTSESGGYAIVDEKGNMLPILSWGTGGAAEFKPIPEKAKLTFLTRPTYPRTYIPELELRVDLPQR